MLTRSSMDLAAATEPLEDFELAMEAFYGLRLTRWASLKPDLQYIVHPSGAGALADPGLSDALAFTLRLEMSF